MVIRVEVAGVRVEVAGVVAVAALRLAALICHARATPSFHLRLFNRNWSVLCIDSLLSPAL